MRKREFEGAESTTAARSKLEAACKPWRATCSTAILVGPLGASVASRSWASSSSPARRVDLGSTHLRALLSEHK